MRKVILLAAAVPLILAPPALADTGEAKAESVCQEPKIDLGYDVKTFSANVSLPASGCASREYRIFTLGVAIARLDHHGGRDETEWSVDYGPFRAASDMAPGEVAPQYSCDLDVAWDHLKVEEDVQYDVTVSYPGAGMDHTASVFTFCTSDGKTASCEQ